MVSPWSHTKEKIVGFLLVLPTARQQGSHITQRKYPDTIPDKDDKRAGVV